ncbi:uncharacterized protein LOC114872049 [Osmia bicornis bicornis]|uniref:uncharacterized protein LOC114872049 n=1 Tax=Osmia bicornis bicornis TaxID=1437191 RepID=UPI001EAF01F8|nr:uncharacterized protein LOC114872049 [Osmia bicornis bicornis]
MALNVYDYKNHIAQCNQIGKLDYYILKIRRSFLKETKISGCESQEVICDTSDQSIVESENLQSSEENVCICPTDSVCTCALSESDSLWTCALSLSDSVCSCAISNLDSFDEEPQECYELIRSEKDKKGISIWEQLVRLKTFDQVGRKNLINNLVRFLCIQTELEYICLEGLSLTPDESVRLVSALYNSRKTMRYVYCWRAFEKMVNTGHRVESKSYEDKSIERYDWFRAIGTLKFLTTLSVNYAYIATPTGDLLIYLAKKLGPNWHWLQLLCLEEDIVRRSNGGTRITNGVIPEAAWQEAHFLAPALKIQYAIIGIPNYDIHKWFFAKSTRIHTFTLSSSVDLRFRQPWYLNCTFKTLYSWYSNTLVYLCLQLWHNREDLDNQLNKLFINLPSLRVFEFIGEIRKLKTLCTMCLQIRSCNCKVHSVDMQLQEILHGDVDKEKWIRSVKCLMVCFKHDFEKMNVKFNIDFYCW